MRILLACCMSLVLSACGTFGEKAVNEPAELKSVENQKLIVEEVWSEDAGKGAGDLQTGFQLAVDGRNVYTANRDGRIVALNLENGEEVWEADTDLRVISGPSVADDTLLVGTRDGQVVALDTKAGKEKWRVEVSSEVLSAPAAGEGRAVVRTLDGRLVAFDLADGRRRWTAQRSVPTLTLRGASSPVIADGAVYAGMDNGQVVSFDLESGELRWEQLIAAPTGRSELERVVDIDAALLLVEDQLYAVSAGAQLGSLSTNSGRVRWKQPIASRSGISFDSDQVFVTDIEGTVWSIDRRSGAQVWQQKDLAYRSLSQPVMYRAYVVVGDFDGYMHWMIPEDGSIVARARPAGDAIRAVPVVVGDLLLVLTTDGEVVALKASFPENQEE